MVALIAIVLLIGVMNGNVAAGIALTGLFIGLSIETLPKNKED